MGAKRTEYQMVGRYMDGKEVTGYHLQSLETGKSGRYTREQVIYLVGRGQITNCGGQIYKDEVILKGIGCNLNELPIQYENGNVTTNREGKVRRGLSGEQIMMQYRVVRCIKNGRTTVGWTIENAGGARKDISTAQTIELARENKLANARVQNYNGSVILRGYNNEDLNRLPRVDVKELELHN